MVRCAMTANAISCGIFFQDPINNHFLFKFNTVFNTYSTRFYVDDLQKD